LLVVGLGATAAQQPARVAPAAKALRFDFSTVTQIRDSFVHLRDGVERGYSLRRYQIVHLDEGTQLVYEELSEERGGYAGYRRTVVDSASGAPIAFRQRLTRRTAMPTPRDTIMAAINVTVDSGVVTGDWCSWTALGDKSCVPIHTALPSGAVWSSARSFGAAALSVEPGDVVAAPAYVELTDSVDTLTVVAEPPEPVVVPAGRFDVLPLRWGAWRIFVTRTVPRRTVREETLDGVERFDLTRRADEGFVDAATIDAPPSLLHGSALAYPESARQARAQGRVVVECILDTSGHVEPGSIRIIDTADPRFEEPARTFLLAADFRPGRVRGRAVRVLVQIPIDFKLSSTR